MQVTAPCYDGTGIMDFASLSGPWTGMSIQDGRRIVEKIHLTISGHTISGGGTDSDGAFDLQGHYDAPTERVTMTRRYTYTTEPTGLSVGMPFDYHGRWDGAIVSGVWVCRPDPFVRGPFEMWPDREVDREELRIALEEVLAVPSGT